MDTIFNSLRNSGFSATCAADMAKYLNMVISRTDMIDPVKDIDDVIKALVAYQLTLEHA